MTPLSFADSAQPRFDGLVEHWRRDGAPGFDDHPAGLVVICEHAAKALPEAWPDLGGDLGLGAQTRDSHAAHDIGALGLARGLAQRLAPAAQGAVLVHAPLSRLAYDLNRAPDHPSGMPALSEIHHAPGNHAQTAQQRLARINAIYLPFHATLSAQVNRLVALGHRPFLLAVHSFTPVYFGAPRAVEFGILFDDDAATAQALFDAAQGCGLDTRLNEPYSAQGEVAHTIRVHAGPLRLRNSMLEIRNDLITDAAAQTAMADRLAPLIETGLHNAGCLKRNT